MSAVPTDVAGKRPANTAVRRRSRFDPARLSNGEIAAANRSAKFSDAAWIFGLLVVVFVLPFAAAYLNL